MTFDKATLMLGLMSVSHQRARGALHLSFKRRGDATVLDNLRQDGCLKARFPHAEAGRWAQAVTLNSAGGVAGGDTLDTAIEAGDGTSATVAGQAAERLYRALPGATAQVTTRLRVAEGAALEWLPQETILFDGCALRRTLTVELAAGAGFTGVESLVFGRAAMGETVRTARLHDRIAVHRAGRLVLLDAIRLQGPVADRLARPAIGGGARGVATLLHVGAGGAEMLDALRAGLAGYEAGVTEVEGVLVMRVVAGSGAELRRAVVTGLNIVRGGRTLPRVWLC